MENESCISLDDLEERIRLTQRYKKMYWKIKRIVLDMPYNIKKIKWFFQRGKRGWADCDWWDMHSYLVQIITPMLKELKENNCGYPGYEEASTPEKWESLLGEMIEGFEAASRVIENDYYKEISGDSIEAITHAPREEILKWSEMASNDQKLFRQKSKIFIKWFFNLWD